MMTEFKCLGKLPFKGYIRGNNINKNINTAYKKICEMSNAHRLSRLGLFLGVLGRLFKVDGVEKITMTSK